MMGTHTALLISPHGLDDDEQAALTQALDMLAMDGMQFRLQPDNVQQAHLVILDDDTETGKSALLRARNGQVKLIISNKSRSGKNLITIQKPINLASLNDLLMRVFKKMYSQIAQQQNSIVNPVKSLDAKLLESNLLTTLLNAKQRQELLQVEIPGFPHIYINGNSKSFATSMEQHELKKIFDVPYEQIITNAISEQDFNAKTQNMHIAALYRLLWIAGIYGSFGQLIVDHDSQRPVKLRAWPNFTRNDFLPQHLKLAAILARQPTALEDLIAATGVSRIDVFNFYNAAYAVDLIDFAAADMAAVPATIPPRSNNNKRRGILAKLAARLKLGP